MIFFKLQVKRVLCRCFKTHSEDRLEARPLFLLQRQRPCLRELSFSLKYTTSSVSILTAVTRDRALRSRRVELEAELSGVHSKHEP